MKRFILALAAILFAVPFAHAEDSGAVSKATQRWNGRKIIREEGLTSTTATGNITITLASTKYQLVATNGSARNVTLPAEEDNKGLDYYFGNTDADGFNLVIKDDAGSTVLTLTDNQGGFVTCSGTAWSGQALSASASGFLAADGSVAGATGQAQDFGANGIKADLLDDSTGAAGVVMAAILDLNAKELILDADADTSLTADTDDQIDVRISGADDFQFTANTFTAVSGSTIATNTIAETTAGSGVTIDSVLCKDGNVYIKDSAADNTLQITSGTDEAGNYTVTIPDLAGNDTLATLAVANTFTGNNTFPNTGLLLKDTGGDHTTNIKQNSNEAGNRTLNIPALGGNDTIATLAVANTFTGNNTFPNTGLLLKDTGGDHTTNIKQNSDEAASRTLNIPALGGDDTIVTLATAQSVTGVKTHSANLIAGNTNLWVLDTGGDHKTNLKQNSDEAADRTLNIPALGGNDTLMTLGVPGTVTGNITFSGNVVRASQRYRGSIAGAKVGSAAGFTVGAASDIFAATCPASQTAAKLVIPVQNLHVGDTITAFGLLGQIESAGNAVTVDADLRKSTAAAGDFTDASVSTITQIAVNADTKIDSTQDKTGLSQVVAQDEMYYIVVTVTTNASTDVDIRGISIVVTQN